MTINNVYNNIAFCEAQGLANCFQSYAENCAGDEICEIGFNSNSGYTYIALECGVSICSMLGATVEFLVTNMDDGEEHFFDDFETAMNFDPYANEEEEEEEQTEWEHPEHDKFRAKQDSDLHNTY